MKVREGMGISARTMVVKVTTEIYREEDFEANEHGGL